MAGKRLTLESLNELAQRPGYGISSPFKGPAVRERAVNSPFDGPGKVDDLESTARAASLRSEAVSLNYSGKCRVSLKFYRRRLADYSRAISEKAILDAIVSSGAIRDDSEAEIQLIDLGQVKVATEAEERTEVTLEYLEVDFDNLFIPRTKFGNAGTK